MGGVPFNLFTHQGYNGAGSTGLSEAYHSAPLH